MVGMRSHDVQCTIQELLLHIAFIFMVNFLAIDLVRRAIPLKSTMGASGADGGASDGRAV
jgi:hypothetical protein